MKTKEQIQFLARFAILLAIEMIVCFTPLGSLPAVGPIVATLSHVPVIITAIALGTKAGTAMGCFFGLFSFLVWTFMPPSPIAFVFTPFYSLGQFHGNMWSLVICFVPRILIGAVTGGLYRLLNSRKLKPGLACMVSGICGSLVNTILVMSGIYIFFGQDYASAIGTTHELLLGIIGLSILTSGIPEAIIGGISAAAVGVPLRKIMTKNM